MTKRRNGFEMRQIARTPSQRMARVARGYACHGCGSKLPRNVHRAVCVGCSPYAVALRAREELNREATP